MTVMRRIPRHRRLRGLALASLLALAARALIPLGYMPGNLLEGEFMVLCPTGMPEGFLVAEGHHHHDAHGDADGMVDADRACPIGTSLKYASAPPDLAIVAEIFRVEPAPPVRLRVFRESQPSRPFLPRGPPRVAS